MDLKLNLPQLHLVCAKDPMRPALEHVMIKGGYAYAADAHIMVKAKLSEFTDREDIIEILEGKYIHKDTWKQIYNKTLLVKEDQLFCQEQYMFVQFNDVEKYPNVEAVIPKVEAELAMPRICFRPDGLHKITKALSLVFQAGSKLKFHGPNRAIKVLDNGNYYESFGIIMPITIG